MFITEHTVAQNPEAEYLTMFLHINWFKSGQSELKEGMSSKSTYQDKYDKVKMDRNVSCFLRDV